MERNALAERVGFEPTLEFPLNTLSKRAPSTTRPPLLGKLQGRMPGPKQDRASKVVLSLAFDLPLKPAHAKSNFSV